MIRPKFKRTHAAAGITCLLLLVAGWFAFDRSPPMVFVSGDVNPKVVSPGQPLSVMIELQWNRLCELDVTRILRDGAGDEHKLPWSKSSPPAKLPEKPLKSVREIIIPTAAKAGKFACYRATIYMTCGMVDHFWPIKVEVPCIPLEIVPR